MRWDPKARTWGALGKPLFAVPGRGVNHVRALSEGKEGWLYGGIYYRIEQIDARMREKCPEVVGDDTPARQTDSKPKPSSAKPNVVASVSRTGSVGRVRLTSTQVALASRLGLTPQQYAAELVKLEKRNG